jgi:hypothetical protein
MTTRSAIVPICFQFSPSLSIQNGYDRESCEVAEKTSDREHFSSESADMPAFTAESVNADIRQHVIETIQGIRGGGSVKARLRTAARLLGLPIDRVRRYHYGEVRRIEAHEAFQIIERSREAKRARVERMRQEYEIARQALVDDAPRGLAWLVPPPMDRGK